MWTHYSKAGEKSKDQEIVFKEAQGKNQNKKSHYLQRSNKFRENFSTETMEDRRRGQDIVIVQKVGFLLGMQGWFNF